MKGRGDGHVKRGVATRKEGMRERIKIKGGGRQQNGEIRRRGETTRERNWKE